MLTGPTAVGKTEVSLLLAERLGGEIISADSVQVYRGLDIGSAKVEFHLTALLFTQRGDRVPEQIGASALSTAPVRLVPFPGCSTSHQLWRPQRVTALYCAASNPHRFPVLERATP